MTLGGLVFVILRTNLERAENCPVEMVTELDLNRERFVDTFDRTVSDNVANELPEFLGGAILPLIDNGDLPNLTDSIAEALAILIDDELDPEHGALNALLTLAQTRTVLESSHALALVTRLLGDADIKDKIHALAGLLLERDGDQTVVDTTLDLAASALVDIDEPSMCSGLELGTAQETMLATEGFTPDASMGGSAWVVRADRNGNPEVRIDPVTGELYAPYVDTDHDRVADVDDMGRPLDSTGTVIEIAAFDPRFPLPAGYDDQGRRLADDGALLFEYYDAKQTALSHLLQLARNALAEDVHRDAADLIEVALGAPINCGDELCYPSEEHPVADLAFALFELIRYERAAAWMDTFGTLLRDRPELAERILVTVGVLLTTIDESNIDITDPELLDMAEGLLPLIAEVAEADNTTGESTARLLLQVIHDLGETSRNFPAQLGYTVDYSVLEKSPECSASPPNLDLSTPVDYQRPRFYAGASGRTVDNRSSLEQSIQLLAAADCGEVPFTGGRSVAYVAIDLLADFEGDEVCSLIDTLFGLLDILPGASRFVAASALDIIGCDGDRVYDSLSALDSLARSGALDFYLPLARVFKERGQLDTLIEILQYVARDLARDEDADANTTSSIRKLLPVISTLIEHDAADALFDLIDILVTVPAADGDGTMGDVMVDSFARTVKTDDIRTRSGATIRSSLAAELLKAIRELSTRLRAEDADESLENVIDHVHGYLTSTEMVAGEPQLRNRNLVPLLRVFSETATDAASLERSNYLCYVDDLQSTTDEFLTGPDFATIIRLIEILEESPDGQIAEDWLLQFLTPERRVDEDLYGPFVQVTAEVLESPFEGDTLVSLLDYAGHVAERRLGDESSMLYIFDQMLQHDGNDAILTIGRALVDHGPLANRERPITTFGDIFGDVASITPGGMCGGEIDYRISEPEAAELIEGTTQFLRDDHGLYSIYELFRRRTRE